MEYATNLIIANVETMSHDVSNSRSFSSDGHQFGGMAPWALPLDPSLTSYAKNIINGALASTADRDDAPVRL